MPVTSLGCVLPVTSATAFRIRQCVAHVLSRCCRCAGESLCVCDVARCLCVPACDVAQWLCTCAGQRLGFVSLGQPAPWLNAMIGMQCCMLQSLPHARDTVGGRQPAAGNTQHCQPRTNSTRPKMCVVDWLTLCGRDEGETRQRCAHGLAAGSHLSLLSCPRPCSVCR